MQVRTGHSSSLLFALLLPLTATAADNLAAHQHGHGQLSLAIDGTRIDLLLESPAYNLAGFEHEPQTQAQRQQLARVREWLQTRPLVDTVPASCRLIDSQVDQTHGHDHEAAEHEHDHGAAEHDHDHDTGEHGHHSDFEVTQTLECPGLADSDKLTTPLLTETEHMEELAVRWAGSRGQGGLHLHGEEGVIELGR